VFAVGRSTVSADRQFVALLERASCRAPQAIGLGRHRGHVFAAAQAWDWIEEAYWVAQTCAVFWRCGLCRLTVGC
jgi:hypothetical protein